MKTYPESKLTDLLIEFDEMGFAPTTVCPNLEQYATEWRERVRKEFARLTAEVSELKSSLTHANEEGLKWHERAQNLLKDSGGSISGYEKKISALQAENAALRARLGNAVEMPCKVGDTIYEATSVGIYEWEVESVYLRKNIFQANCVNKNDYKMHWNFIKADYCNEFEGRGRVRVNRLEAEARLAELKGGME